MAITSISYLLTHCSHRFGNGFGAYDGPKHIAPNFRTDSLDHAPQRNDDDSRWVADTAIDNVDAAELSNNNHQRKAHH